MTDFEKKIQSINDVVDAKVLNYLKEYEARLNKIYTSKKKINELYEKEKKLQEESAKKQKDFIIDLLKKNSYASGDLSVKKQIADYEKEELKTLKEKNVALVEELKNKKESLQSTLDEYKSEREGLAKTEAQKEQLSQKDRARYDLLNEKIKTCKKSYNQFSKEMRDANKSLESTTKELEKIEEISKG